MAGKPNGPTSGPPRVPTEEELSRLSREELVRRLRWTEGDRLRRIAEHSNIMKDVNRRMQALRNEASARGGAPNDVHSKLESDNQELRDLCCFLDDDRQKGSNLAQEWQRFGQYSANVLRTELAGYQDKLKELETRQQQLMQENLELKELCFLLDEEQKLERRNSLCSKCNVALNLAPRLQMDRNGMSNHGNQGNELQQRNAHQYPPAVENGEMHQGKPKVPRKPDSMAHALKVLEVHDKLEHGTSSGIDAEYMNDNHKAIVREMCNVVWRKLGDDPAKQGNQPAPSSGPVPPRYPGGSTGPPGTPPKYFGSTGSLDRKGI